MNGEQTEALYDDDDDKTEYVDGDGDLTEFISDDDSEKTEFLAPSPTSGIDWKRSDVYSLGATIYHLLSGKYPPERASDVVPLSKVGRFNEGITFIVEQSMQLNPAKRFASANALADAINNIHKHDIRWKISQSKKMVAAIMLPLIFAVFAVVTLIGQNIMAQEKEERYYAAVFTVMDSGDLLAFSDALDMFWDRVDPYTAMARYLWDEGDIEACRRFIEENLGNIAKFQDMPEAHMGFGDIYFILGNTYYYQSGEPDFHMARQYFEIAVQFVRDNPVYYRDYAITLARTGSVAEAERILERAQVLNLDADSLNLLNGELAFAKGDYENAVQFLNRVISAAGDDYIRYRAYHASDDIFKLLGQPERSIDLLSGSLNRIPLNRVPEMTERLADAYVKSGDYESAIRLFEQLLERGVPQFHIMQNLAILTQNAEDFARSAEVLERMTDLFPYDYRVPMRQAYLEADMQSRIANESRDYSLTKQFYDAAVALYSENVRPGHSDPEMQQLDFLIEQLRQHRWID
jgi:serine/threonine-protein kinase